MTNIEIKSEIKNKSGDTINATYTGYYMMGAYPLEYTFVKRDFYLNLDTISSFSFGNIEDDTEVNVDRYGQHSDSEFITFKKGLSFIELFKIEDEVELPYMMLTFLHKGEYQRTKRILTEKLCTK